MSTDDPGWGEYVPVSPDDPSTVAPPPPSSAAPRPAPTATPGRSGGSRRIALVAAAVIVVAAVAGVLIWQLGGSSNGGSSKLTLAQWASKADAVCSQFLPQVNEDSNDPQAELSVVNQELSKVRALGDPTTDANTVHTYLSDIEQTAQANADGDSSTASQGFAQSQQLATNLGLTVCN